MIDNELPTDIEACHLVIAKLQSQLDAQATELSLKHKLVEEQAHSVLQLKENNDRLDEKAAELNRKVEALLQQLYGRKSERRVDGVGQLLLDPGEEATPEVVSALKGYGTHHQRSPLQRCQLLHARHCQCRRRRNEQQNHVD